jgi:hypothetical protein
METIMDALTKRGIILSEGQKIILYNNRHFTSPIEVYPDDEYQDDYAVILLPESYPLPRNKTHIELAGKKGFPLHILYTGGH